MCGMMGLVRRAAPEELQAQLAPMLAALHHRGPDDRGQWVSEASPDGWRCALGHTRLAIIDLSPDGHQPMLTGDGRAAIAFNGEIYNYLELRATLEAQGRTFRSSSDTEVLLQALCHEGQAALARLVGMFAFAWYDQDRQRLWLVRDPFGIKPLFYAAGAHGLAFASEIKALLTLPEVARAVDPVQVVDYLTRARSDAGERTFFRDIRQLPAGCLVAFDLVTGQLGAVQRYWEPQAAPSCLSHDQAVAQVRQQFLDNVRLHLRSDVAVGAALSGGIDSSSIVAAMRHLEPALPIHVFSFIADDAAVSEERWVDVVAQHTGAVVHKIRASRDELAADLPQLIAVQDEPFGSTSIYAQYRVFRAAREQGIKVMLDGQGADELLAGYTYFQPSRLLGTLGEQGIGAAWRWWRQLARQGGARRAALVLAAAGARHLPPGLARTLAGRRGGHRLQAVHADWLAQASPSELDFAWPSLQAHLRHAVSQQLPALLRYEDRNSMAHAIESRVPFLTPDFGELVLGLPATSLLSDQGVSKAVLRDAMRGIVPDAILDRRDKIGFATPEAAWLRGLAPWVEGVFARMGPRQPVLDMARVQAHWQRFLRQEVGFDWTLWRWINFLCWAEVQQVTFD